MLLSCALASLNLRMVRGKSLAFEKLCLARSERLALMIRGRLLHRAHAAVSSFQFHPKKRDIVAYFFLPLWASSSIACCILR